MNSNSDPQSYVLELSFDANQVTQALQYKVFTAQGKRCDKEQYGKLAGTFNFNQGDEMSVRVVGSIEGDGNTGGEPNLEFTVMDCTFISIKSRGVSELSMFDPNMARSTIAAWLDPVTEYDKKEDRKSVTISSSHAFPVTSENGMWEISGYLSVVINNGSKTYSELYYFDPEGSVGGGGGFEPP